MNEKRKIYIVEDKYYSVKDAFFTEAEAEEWIKSVWDLDYSWEYHRAQYIIKVKEEADRE